MAGLQMPHRSPEERAQEQRNLSLYDVLDCAMQWFRRRLKPHTPGWEYLRGV